MEPLLLAFTGATLALAALAAWLGFTGRRRYALRYRVVAALSLFVVAPALGFVLRAQATAGVTLDHWGIPAHPATEGARGLPGLDEDGGSTAFAVAAPRDSVRAFYLERLPRTGWRVTLIHPGVLFFERAGHELMVRVEERGAAAHVVFSVERQAEPPDEP